MDKKEYVYTILKCNGQKEGFVICPKCDLSFSINLKKMYEEWKEEGAKAEAKKIFDDIENWFKKAQDLYKKRYDKLNKMENKGIWTDQQIDEYDSYKTILQFIYGFSLEFKRLKQKQEVKNG